MSHPLDLQQLALDIKQWGLSLGFQQVGICDTDLSAEEPKLQAWLDKQYHGEMAWMERHGMMRARPHELQPGTLRVISVRMNYLPAKAAFASTLKNPQLGYVSRYALGRDYHKVLRNRLKKLGEMIRERCESLNFRPFVDSAPLLERPLAEKAGLGWTGKHSLILNREAGSWFFLGELLIDLPLPTDEPQPENCGRCVACITTCPTGAIVEPYVVDARRCISYLTIELEGAIPEENRFGQLTDEDDFSPRAVLHAPPLVELFAWDEARFLKVTEGSAIRRIGHLRWLRNVAVALGNAPWHDDHYAVLASRLGENAMLDEHIHWAMAQQREKRARNAIDVQLPQQKRLVRAVEKGLPRDA
jgi:epoxyqueuosine reductase